MRVETLGDGEPDVAVIAGIHGDEPAGVRAIERLLASDPAVERPVALVVANEEALAAGRRHVDEDLNRAFPGDPDGDTHESRLAARLTERFADVEALSLHTTQSYDDPFAIVHGLDPGRLRRCSQLPIDAVVDAGVFDAGRLFSGVPDAIEVECGRQGSAAAVDNAAEVVRAFLAATGVLPDEAPAASDDVPIFRLERKIDKPSATDYEVVVENFERVPAGTAFATADGRELEAEEGFYPVLVSARGYEGMFGYAASRVDAETVRGRDLDRPDDAGGPD